MGHRKTKPVPAAPSMDGRTLALITVTVLLLAAALLPCAVSLSPQVYFDVDPRSVVGRGPITALGPAPQAWYHTGVVTLAAVALALHLSWGGRLRWLSTILVFIGAGFCAWHMPARFDGMIRGGAWIAAAMLSLAVLHLAEHALVRRLIAAAVVAMLVPMTLDALSYVFVEHPATVETFRRDEAQFLASRGWAEGSPQHLLYKRRLEFPDATGAFGLSNIFGSVVAAFTLAALAAAWRHRRHRAPLIAAALCLACGLASLYLTHSKGPPAALLLGALCLTLASSRWRRWSPYIALILILVPIAAVALRGSLGLPADHTGERSLLFRYQYWKAVPAILHRHPVTGTGPGGFKDAYLLAKDPFNPEDVTAAHSVFIDWIAMLGVGGAAWTLLLLGWLWCAGRQASRDGAASSPLSDGGGAGPRSRETLALLAVGAIMFGVQYACELPQMLPEMAVAWILGVVAFVGVSATLAVPARDVRWPRLALFAAAVALVVHGQIEMTFFQESSCMVAWLLIGAAAAAEEPVPRRSRLAWAAPAFMLLTAIVLAVAYAAPVQRQQAKLARAAALMQAAPSGAAAVSVLDEAAAILPADATAVQWQVQLLLEHAAGLSDRDQAQQALATALALLRDRLATRGDDPSLLRWLAQVHRLRARMTGDAQAWAEAIAAMKRLIALNPYGIQDRMALADLWWATGNRSEAEAQYRRCLKLSEQAYLDPLRQLSTTDRQLIRDRIGE